MRECTKPRAKRRLLCLVFILGGCIAGTPLCSAQATPAVANESTGSDPTISPVMGFNFALSELGQHNSATGWADIVTPTVTYRFDKHFLLSASTPWYPTVKAYVSANANGTGATQLKSGTNLLGDTELAGHLEFAPGKFTDLLNAAGDFPTGNVRFGLGANTETYNVTNHMDYQLGPFDPDIEFGEGNNSSLANTVARKSYVAVGPILNFQAGTSIDLPFNLNLDLEAYEDLPIGNQNVYGTVTRKGKNGKTHTKQVLDGQGAVEDNGFNAELDLPVGQHFTLIGLYERSLIQGLDTASVGVTWSLRAPKLHGSARVR